MTMILSLWLALGAPPVRVEIDGEACRSAVEAFSAGSIIKVEDEQGRQHPAVWVACEPTQGPTS